MEPFNFDELDELPTVVDLTTAARALGIGRTKAYKLAQRGDFPCRLLHVGNSYSVPTAELRKLLGLSLTRRHPSNPPD